MKFNHSTRSSRNPAPISANRSPIELLESRMLLSAAPIFLSPIDRVEMIGPKSLHVASNSSREAASPAPVAATSGVVPTSHGDIGDTIASAEVVSGLTTATPYTHSDAVGNGPNTTSDVDLFQVTVAAGDILTALTSQPGGGAAMDAYLRLFDAAGNELASDDDDGPASYSRLNYTFASAGTYYIGVSGFGNELYNANTSGSGAVGDTGDYQLALYLGDIGDTRFSAKVTGLSAINPFELTEDIGNGPHTTRDVDLYRFEAAAGDTLIAETHLPGGGTAFDSFLRLFNSTGTQIINDDDSGTDAGYSRIEHTFASSGTYYLGVSGYPNFTYSTADGGSGAVGATGDYRLTLDIESDDSDPPLVDFFQINNGAAQRSNLSHINITFDEPMNIPSLISAGTLDNSIKVYDKAAPSTPLAWVGDSHFQWNASTNALRVDLTADGNGGSTVTHLPNGRYEVRLTTSALTDTAGNPLVDTDGTNNGILVIDRTGVTQNFFRLGGDLQGDADVDLNDLSLLAAHYDIGPGGDADGDGDTDLSDLALLSTYYGTSI